MTSQVELQPYALAAIAREIPLLYPVVRGAFNPVVPLVRRDATQIVVLVGRQRVRMRCPEAWQGLFVLSPGKHAAEKTVQLLVEDYEAWVQQKGLVRRVSLQD